MQEPLLPDTPQPKRSTGFFQGVLQTFPCFRPAKQQSFDERPNTIEFLNDEKPNSGGQSREALLKKLRSLESDLKELNEQEKSAKLARDRTQEKLNQAEEALAIQKAPIVINSGNEQAQISELTSKVKTMESKLKDLEKENESLNNQVKKSSTSDSGKQILQLKSAEENLLIEKKNLQQEFQKSQQSVQKNNEKVNILRQQVNSLEKSIEEVDKKIKDAAGDEAPTTAPGPARRGFRLPSGGASSVTSTPPVVSSAEDSTTPAAATPAPEIKRGSLANRMAMFQNQ